MNRIQEVLIEQGRTQVWLSKQLNRSDETISRYCTNKIQTDNIYMEKIASLLNVPVEVLIVKPCPDCMGNMIYNVIEKHWICLNCKNVVE